jgi:hypothetical protein
MFLLAILLHRSSLHCSNPTTRACGGTAAAVSSTLGACAIIQGFSLFVEEELQRKKKEGRNEAQNSNRPGSTFGALVAPRG